MPADREQITHAKEAERIGREVIDRCHRHLANEDEVRIVFLFSSKARKAKGKPVLASTKRMSPTEVYLHYGGPASETGEEVSEIAHYRILFSLTEFALLDDRQRVALVDHELSHIAARVSDDGELSFTLVDHDVAEFVAIIERHGAWIEPLRQFIDAGAKQLALFEDARP